MLKWIHSLLGTESKDDGAVGLAIAREIRENRAAAPSRPTVHDLHPDARRFFLRLVTTVEPSDLQAFPEDDRLFLSGILKRIRENRLEVPVLPRAAIEISRLLSDVNSDVKDFVRVLEADPALSVDVLRMANSAYYGFTRDTTSVRDAVVRIGMSRIRALIISTHLQGKILQAACFQREAGWLTNLSAALAQVGQILAPSLGLPADAGFTKGMLWHVEHFIIISTVTHVSMENRRKLLPTAQGLQEAFFRFGQRVRDLASKAWGLEDLLVGGPKGAEISTRFYQIRQALVANWTGADIPRQVNGVSPELLTRALSSVNPVDTIR